MKNVHYFKQSEQDYRFFSMTTITNTSVIEPPPQENQDVYFSQILNSGHAKNTWISALLVEKLFEVTPRIELGLWSDTCSVPLVDRSQLYSLPSHISSVVGGFVNSCFECGGFWDVRLQCLFCLWEHLWSFLPVSQKHNN